MRNAVMPRSLRAQLENTETYKQKVPRPNLKQGIRYRSMKYCVQILLTITVRNPGQAFKRIVWTLYEISKVFIFPCGFILMSHNKPSKYFKAGGESVWTLETLCDLKLACY